MNSVEYNAARTLYYKAVHTFSEAQYRRRHGALSAAAYRAEEERFLEATAAFDALKNPEAP